MPEGVGYKFEDMMRSNRGRKKKTLASKTGVSQKKLSSKIRKVKHEDPGLTKSQAAGKAAGILKHRKKKG
jgi:hypothetical protein